MTKARFTSEVELGPNSKPDIRVDTWFERDRAHVAVYKNDKLVIEWWDEDVEAAIIDGFLDNRDLYRSAKDYAQQLGLI